MRAVCLSLFLGAASLGLLHAAQPPEKPSIWTVEAAKDGTQTVTDGTLRVAFPADVKVKPSGDYASASIEEKTGAKAKGYVSVSRKPLPAEAKQAADPHKWLEEHVKAGVEKDRNATAKVDGRETKDYRSVRLVKSEKLDLGAAKGWTSVIDTERELPSLKIEGGLHSVTERRLFIVGDSLYTLTAGGSGAPQAAALFGDNTGFHRSETAQKFFKSAQLSK
jgi:hypothetical protein